MIDCGSPAQGRSKTNYGISHSKDHFSYQFPKIKKEKKSLVHTFPFSCTATWDYIKAIPSCSQFGGQQTQDSCFIRHWGSGSGNSYIGRIENGIFQKVFCTCANHFRGGSKGEYSRVAAYWGWVLQFCFIQFSFKCNWTQAENFPSFCCVQALFLALSVKLKLRLVTNSLNLWLQEFMCSWRYTVIKK